MSKCERGYTLAEVMTVVGVLALLASVAVPAFITVRRNAKISEIRANLKAIQDSTQAYCSINKIQPASCTNIGSAQLVPTYLSAWPGGGTGVDKRDSYSLNASGVTCYLGTYTYADMYDSTKSAAAVAAAGY